MTRIAYVCADPGVPIFGRKGCSVHVQEVVRAFRRARADVEIFASRLGNEPPTDLVDISVNRFPLQPTDDLRERERRLAASNHAMAQALKRAAPFDLVYERFSLWSHAGMETACELGATGLLEVNAPLIDEQATYRGLLNRSEAERIARKTFAAASAIVAVSDEVARYLDQFVESHGRVTVIPNGVDVNRFHPDVPAVAQSGDQITIGFVGTLKPWHGVSLLLRAFNEIHRTHPRSRLLIVGDGPERSALESETNMLRLRDAVDWTGAVDPEHVPGLVTSMDIAIAPYPRDDQFYFSPLKVYEYMAAGRAVVASGIGQILRVIEDGVNGIIVPPGNSEAMVSAMTRLASNEVLRCRLGWAARTTIVKNHTWDTVAQKLLNIAASQHSVRDRQVFPPTSTCATHAVANDMELLQEVL